MSFWDNKVVGWERVLKSIFERRGREGFAENAEKKLSEIQRKHQDIQERKKFQFF